MGGKYQIGSYGSKMGRRGHLVQDAGKLWVLVNTIMNLRIP